MGLFALLNAGASLLNILLYMYAGSLVSLFFAIFSGTVAVLLAFLGD